MLKWFIMVAFPKSRARRIANIFLKKIKHYYLGWPIGGYPCELWNKNHPRTRIQSHTCIHTHTCKHTKTTHACKDTHMHASVCSRVHTHTKCSFVIGDPSLRNHMPHTVKEAGSHSLTRYLKRSYLVNLSKYRLVSEFVTVPLTLFYLFVVKYVAKCPISSYETSVSTCAMYATLWKVTKFMFHYLARIRQVLTLREVE